MNRKKAVAVVLIVEAFLIFAGTIIHECTHAFLFYFTDGSFGTIRFLHDGYLGVCYPPKGVVVTNTLFQETCAYGTQIISTILFAIILIYFVNKRERQARMITHRLCD